MEKLIIPEGCELEGEITSVRHESDIFISGTIVPSRMESTNGHIRFISKSGTAACEEILAPQGQIILEAGSLVVDKLHGAGAEVRAAECECSDIAMTGILTIGADDLVLGRVRAESAVISGDTIKADSIHVTGELRLESNLVMVREIRAGKVVVQGSLDCKSLVASESVVVESGSVAVKRLEAPSFHAASGVSGIVVVAVCDDVKAEGVRGFLHPSELGLLTEAGGDGPAVKPAPKPAAPAPPIVDDADDAPVGRTADSLLELGSPTDSHDVLMPSVATDLDDDTDPDPQSPVAPAAPEPPLYFHPGEAADAADADGAEDDAAEAVPEADPVDAADVAPVESMDDDPGIDADDVEELHTGDLDDEPLDEEEAAAMAAAVTEDDFAGDADDAFDVGDADGFDMDEPSFADDEDDEDDVPETPSPGYDTRDVSGSEAHDTRRRLPSGEFDTVALDPEAIAELNASATAAVVEELPDELELPDNLDGVDAMDVDDFGDDLDDPLDDDHLDDDHLDDDHLDDDHLDDDHLDDDHLDDDHLDEDAYDAGDAFDAGLPEVDGFDDEPVGVADAADSSPEGGFENMSEFSAEDLGDDLGEPDELGAEDLDDLSSSFEPEDLQELAADDLVDVTGTSAGSDALPDVATVAVVEDTAASLDDPLGEIDDDVDDDDLGDIYNDAVEDVLGNTGDAEEDDGDDVLGVEVEEAVDPEDEVIADLGEIMERIRAYFPEDNYPPYINQIMRYLDERRLNLFFKESNRGAVQSSFDKFNHAEISALVRTFFERLDVYRRLIG